MLKKIRKLGIANFHTYQEETFDINGNVLMFKADNGTGKTTVMTSMYPTLFTFDLNDALNFGKGLARNARGLVKDDTYIFGVFENNNGPYSIVMNFTIKQNGDVKKKAFILNTTEIKVTSEDGGTIPVSEFEKNHKEHIVESFTTSRSYLEWVARNIFGVNVQLFKTYIKAQHKFASSANEAKSEFNVGTLMQETKDSLDKIENDPTLKSIILTYADRVIVAAEKQNELNKKTSLRDALAEQRSYFNKNNNDTANKIKRIQKEMAKELTDLEFNLEKSDETLTKYENELDKLEIAIKNLKYQEDDYSIKLREVEREIDKLDIDTKRENLAKELKRIQERAIDIEKSRQNSLKAKERTENSLSKSNNKLIDLNNRKEAIGEITPLPFELNEWNSIEESHKLFEKTLQEQQSLTASLNVVKNNYSNELAEKNNLVIKINEETARFNNDLENYYHSCNARPGVNESLEVFKNRLYEALTYEITELNSSINTLVNEQKENEKYLKELQASTKPVTHFISENATPLFEIIDFKENVDTNTKERIEALLQMSGLLELLVEENNTDKGLILCRN